MRSIPPFLPSGRLMKGFFYVIVLSAASMSTAQTYRCVDSNGRAFFTNLGCDNTQRPIPAGNTSNPGRGNTSSLAALLDSVSLETNPEKRRNLSDQIHAGFASYKARAIAEAQSQAESKSGVPELERQLRDAEARDRADPQWQHFKSDSPITSGIRSQLLAAREQANRSAAGLLETNAEYARMRARYSVFEKSN